VKPAGFLLFYLVEIPRLVASLLGSLRLVSLAAVHFQRLTALFSGS
jgi:hypothetical protein